MTEAGVYGRDLVLRNYEWHRGNFLSGQLDDGRHDPHRHRDQYSDRRRDGSLGVHTRSRSRRIFGAHDDAIRDGLFGYNAALTGMALGGTFLLLTLPGFLYTVMGILVTARAWASIAIFLEPAGMPVFTSAFVFVTWFMLLAHGSFKMLVLIPPAQSSTPEENLQRARALKTDR